MASIDYWESRGRKIYSGSKPKKTQQQYRNEVRAAQQPQSEDPYLQQEVLTPAQLTEYDDAKIYKSKLDRISPSIGTIKKNIQIAQECLSDGGLVCENLSLNPRFDSILEKFYAIEKAVNLSIEHFQSIITKVESTKF